MNANTGIIQGRCTGKIQDGRHSDLRHTLSRIPKALWPRDMSLYVIVMTNLSTTYKKMYENILEKT